MPDPAEILKHCTNILPGYSPHKPLKARLLELAEALGDDDFGDVYGGGTGLATF